MENILVIGDVGAQYDALQNLLNKIPAEEKERIIFVGDLMDRGDKPIEVVDFVKNNAECIYGNHEDMFVDYYRKQGRYQHGLWINYNGGEPTADAYANAGENKLNEHLDYIENLPWFIETENFFISHGIWSKYYDLEQAQQIFETTPNGQRGQNNLIWNRDSITPRGKFQIYGHNGHNELTDYSLCIDGQRDFPKSVCAYNTATKKIYKESFF